MLSGSSRRQRRAIDFPAVQPQALLRHPPKIRPADLEAMMVAIALLHPTPDFTRTDRNDDPTDADTTAGLGKLNALSFAGVVVQIAGPRDQFLDQCPTIGKKPFQPDPWQIRAGRKDAVTFKSQQLGFGRRHGAVLDKIGAQPVRLGSDLRRCVMTEWSRRRSRTCPRTSSPTATGQASRIQSRSMSRNTAKPALSR